jgi:hypothetical protein
MSFVRWLSRLTRKARPARRRPPLSLEVLENRTLLTVQPLTLADPTLWGATGLKDSTRPSLSADGQLVAFASNADNLVPNDTNGRADAFVFNRGTGTVTLVSAGPTGLAAGIDGSTAPVISPDGRYVVPPTAIDGTFSQESGRGKASSPSAGQPAEWEASCSTRIASPTPCRLRQAPALPRRQTARFRAAPTTTRPRNRQLPPAPPRRTAA